MLLTGYYVSHSISSFGESMAEKTVRQGIESQVRYNMGTIKDGEACSGFKARIGKVINVKTTAESTPQLIVLSNEARENDCLK